MINFNGSKPTEKKILQCEVEKKLFATNISPIWNSVWYFFHSGIHLNALLSHINTVKYTEEAIFTFSLDLKL